MIYELILADTAARRIGYRSRDGMKALVAAMSELEVVVRQKKHRSKVVQGKLDSERLDWSISLL